MRKCPLTSFCFLCLFFDVCFVVSWVLFSLALELCAVAGLTSVAKLTAYVIILLNHSCLEELSPLKLIDIALKLHEVALETQRTRKIKVSRTRT